MDLGRLKRRVGQAVQKLHQRPLVLQRKGDAMPGAFIIAAPRSGTTLLRVMCDSHPHIAAPPETKLFRPILSALEDNEAVQAMWHLGFHRDAVAASLGDCCRGFLEAYALSKGKRMWVEKTPAYVDILPLLREAFADARFILLYRHPLDVVQSILTRQKTVGVPGVQPYRLNYPGSDLTAASVFLADQLKRMRDFQQKNASVCHVVKYEDITSGAESALREICAFVGVEYDPAMTAFYEQRHDFGLGDVKVQHSMGIEPRQGTYTDWSQDQLNEALHFLQADMTALGYQV